MTTTLYAPVPYTSITCQGYNITQAGTAVPDNLVQTIISAVYQADGVTLTTSAGGSSVSYVGGSLYNTGTGAPSSTAYPDGMEARDSTGAAFVLVGGTWKPLGSGTFAPLARSITSVTASTQSGAISLTNGAALDVLLDANWTLSLSGAAAGSLYSVILRLKQPSSGGPKTFTPPSGTSWPGQGSQPALSTAANAIDLVRLETWDGGTTWQGYFLNSGITPTQAGAILASAQYDGGSTAGTTYTASSSTLTAIDATNFSVTFTAPASGAVEIRYSGYGGRNVAWVANYAMVDTSGNYVTGTIVAAGNNPANVFVRSAATVKVTGLTPGQSYTWRWAFCATTGTYQLYTSRPVITGNVVTSNSGPAIVEVLAA